MKRIICAAVVALALMFAGSGEAKANGFGPGFITLSGSIGLSWGHTSPSYGGGCQGCYAPPAMYNAYGAGYGGYYGGMPSYPMGYGYGY